MGSYLRTALIAAFVSAFIAATIFFFMGGSRDQQAHAPTSIYATARSARTIRAAYAVGAPLFTIDPNTGEKSGIFHDVVTQAAEKLGIKVNWNEEIGYGEMIQGLDARRYDIVGSGVWINADRGKDADFTMPIYYDAVFAYVKNSDSRFDTGLSVLNLPEFTISEMGN